MAVAGRARNTSGRPDLEAAAAVVAARVRAGILPSAVFGVADRHGIVGYRAATGSGRAVDERTIFFLASVTKPIVATAVMQYVDEGRLDLHVPLVRYLPEFSGRGREQVTAWHVLTHTSGVPDSSIEGLLRDRPPYERELRSVFRTVPDFEPGSRVQYASSAWMLLAETMSRLSGMPFARALRTRLTGPLGMLDTTFDPRYDRRRVAPLHGLRIRNRLVEEALVRFMARATLPGGGLFGTVHDLLRLGQALLPAEGGGHSRRGGTRVLRQTTIDDMARRQTWGLSEILADGSERESRYALGWAKPGPDLPGSPSAITHGGAAGGRLWVDRAHGIVFAFLTNLWGAPDEPAWATLRELYVTGGPGNARAQRD